MFLKNKTLYTFLRILQKSTQTNFIYLTKWLLFTFFERIPKKDLKNRYVQGEKWFDVTLCIEETTTQISQLKQ